MVVLYVDFDVISFPKVCTFIYRLRRNNISGCTYSLGIFILDIETLKMTWSSWVRSPYVVLV